MDVRKNKNVVALMYHAIAPERTKDTYTISYPDFREHMNYLSEHGYTCILADEYQTSLLGKKTLPQKTVLLTFDDGHASDYHVVLPVLKEFGFSATFFVTTDWIDTPGYMTSSEIAELKASGMSVQSHAKTHVFLNELDCKGIDEELADSKKRLERIIGDEVIYISFPGGRYNDDVIICAKKLGYRGLFTSVPFSLSVDEPLFLGGRQSMKYTSAVLNFHKVMNPGYTEKLLVTWRHTAKSLLKMLIGNRLYYKLWKSVMKE